MAIEKNAYLRLNMKDGVNELIAEESKRWVADITYNAKRQRYYVELKNGSAAVRKQRSFRDLDAAQHWAMSQWIEWQATLHYGG